MSETKDTVTVCCKVDCPVEAPEVGDLVPSHRCKCACPPTVIVKGFVPEDE